MRYLIFLSGLDKKDKPKFEKELDSIAESEDLLLRNLYPDENVALVYITSNKLSVVEIKDKIKVVSDYFNLTYFVQEHNEALYMNLSDEDSEHLFGIAFVKPNNSESDFERWLLDEEDSDDDEMDLIQKLIKEKYGYKEKEPTLDEILDKINQKGVSSLSFQEQAILKNYN